MRFYTGLAKSFCAPVGSRLWIRMEVTMSAQHLYLGSERTPTGICQRLRPQPELLYVRDFPTFSTVQHPYCTCAQEFSNILYSCSGVGGLRVWLGTLQQKFFLWYLEKSVTRLDTTSLSHLIWTEVPLLVLLFYIQPPFPLPTSTHAPILLIPIVKKKKKEK
jgi:hypothetical protein